MLWVDLEICAEQDLFAMIFKSTISSRAEDVDQLLTAFAPKVSLCLSFVIYRKSAVDRFSYQW